MVFCDRKKGILYFFVLEWHRRLWIHTWEEGLYFLPAMMHYCVADDVFHSNSRTNTVSSHRLGCIYCIIYHASGGGLDVHYFFMCYVCKASQRFISFTEWLVNIASQYRKWLTNMCIVAYKVILLNNIANMETIIFFCKVRTIDLNHLHSVRFLHVFF